VHGKDKLVRWGNVLMRGGGSQKRKLPSDMMSSIKASSGKMVNRKKDGVSTKAAMMLGGTVIP